MKGGLFFACVCDYVVLLCCVLCLFVEFGPASSANLLHVGPVLAVHGHQVLHAFPDEDLDGLRVQEMHEVPEGLPRGPLLLLEDVAVATLAVLEGQLAEVLAAPAPHCQGRIVTIRDHALLQVAGAITAMLVPWRQALHS